MKTSTQDLQDFFKVSPKHGEQKDITDKEQTSIKNTRLIVFLNFSSLKYEPVISV